MPCVATKSHSPFLFFCSSCPRIPHSRPSPSPPLLLLLLLLLLLQLLPVQCNQNPPASSSESSLDSEGGAWLRSSFLPPSPHHLQPTACVLHVALCDE
jgi:hypothetical protein